METGITFEAVHCTGRKDGAAEVDASRAACNMLAASVKSRPAPCNPAPEYC